MDSIMVWIFGICFSATVGALIGRSKGNERMGALLGAFIGPVGWLIIAMMPDERPTCPECGGVVVEDARRCMNCGGYLPCSDSSTSDEEANQEQERRSRELF